MTINERVKELRKVLSLSGEKFGAKLGLTRMAISKIENGQVGVSEANILSICREFNVSEHWLRTGNGDMFNELSEIPLEDLTSGLDPLELDILKAYFSLDKDIRKKVLEHFRKALSRNP